MRRIGYLMILVVFAGLLSLAGCETPQDVPPARGAGLLLGAPPAAADRTNTQTAASTAARPAATGVTTDNTGVIKPNAYGPGVHQNRYGQPVRLVPDFGGVPGEQLQIKTDAYGPGVHMDQYGRPVRERRW